MLRAALYVLACKVSFKTQVLESIISIVTEDLGNASASYVEDVVLVSAFHML